MVADLGLLTREGMEYFYPIFKDMQNCATPNYVDPFPGVPFKNKPRGLDAKPKYRQMLLEVRVASVLGAEGIANVAQERNDACLRGDGRRKGNQGESSWYGTPEPRNPLSFRPMLTGLSSRLGHCGKLGCAQCVFPSQAGHSPVD